MAKTKKNKSIELSIENYSIAEQKAAQKAAKLLKVEYDIAFAINRLVDTEAAVTALRKALLQTEVLA